MTTKTKTTLLNEAAKRLKWIFRMDAGLLAIAGGVFLTVIAVYSNVKAQPEVNAKFEARLTALELEKFETKIEFQRVHGKIDTANGKLDILLQRTK